MRFVVTALVVATVSTVHAEPAREPAAVVASVPAVATVARGRARIVIRSDAPKRRYAEVATVVDQVVSDVERRFTGATTDADPEVTLCLMSTDASYRDVGSVFGDLPSDWGFYLPGHRVAIANLGVSIGNLRHELVHPLLGDDFPEIPAWLNEGTAALYGTATWTKRGFVFAVNYRLRDLQRALADHTLPTIAELARSTDDDVRGPHAMVMYAMARYVLLYVDRQGKLGKLYAELRGASGDVTAQRDILLHYVDDTAFRAWAKRLRWG